MFGSNLMGSNPGGLCCACAAVLVRPRDVWEPAEPGVWSATCLAAFCEARSPEESVVRAASVRPGCACLAGGPSAACPDLVRVWAFVMALWMPPKPSKYSPTSETGNRTRNNIPGRNFMGFPPLGARSQILADSITGLLKAIPGCRERVLQRPLRFAGIAAARPECYRSNPRSTLFFSLIFSLCGFYLFTLWILSFHSVDSLSLFLASPRLSTALDERGHQTHT